MLFSSRSGMMWQQSSPGETWVSSSGGALNLISYSYDADNELTGAADNYATLTFGFDSGGNQITAATSGPGTGQPSVTLTSAYDARGARGGHS